MHYAIHKLHWSPSKIDEWFDCPQEVKAFYYGSLALKIERDRKEAEKAKRQGSKRR